MKKQQYTAPSIEQVKLLFDQLMIGASPGVGGDYDPSKPIDAKEGFFDEEEMDKSMEYEKFSVWDS